MTREWHTCEPASDCGLLRDTGAPNIMCHKRPPAYTAMTYPPILAESHRPPSRRGISARTAGGSRPRSTKRESDGRSDRQHYARRRTQVFGSCPVRGDRSKRLPSGPWLMAYLNLHCWPGMQQLKWPICLLTSSWLRKTTCPCFVHWVLPRIHPACSNLRSGGSCFRCSIAPHLVTLPRMRRRVS